MYKLKSLDGRETLSVERVGEDKLKLKMGKKELIALTEDLAALVRAELPQDRARELFSEVESAVLQSGKARVAVQARADIKKGEPVVFTIDINKYMNSKGQATGVRIAPQSGLIF